MGFEETKEEVAARHRAVVNNIKKRMKTPADQVEINQVIAFFRCEMKDKYCLDKRSAEDKHAFDVAVLSIARLMQTFRAAQATNVKIGNEIDQWKEIRRAARTLLDSRPRKHKTQRDAVRDLECALKKLIDTLKSDDPARCSFFIDILCHQIYPPVKQSASVLGIGQRSGRPKRDDGPRPRIDREQIERAVQPLKPALELIKEHFGPLAEEGKEKGRTPHKLWHVHAKALFPFIQQACKALGRGTGPSVGGYLVRILCRILKTIDGVEHCPNAVDLILRRSNFSGKNNRDL